MSEDLDFSLLLKETKSRHAMSEDLDFTVLLKEIMWSCRLLIIETNEWMEEGRCVKAAMRRARVKSVELEKLLKEFRKQSVKLQKRHPGPCKRKGERNAT